MGHDGPFWAMMEANGEINCEDSLPSFFPIGNAFWQFFSGKYEVGTEIVLLLLSCPQVNSTPPWCNPVPSSAHTVHYAAMPEKVGESERSESDTDCDDPWWVQMGTMGEKLGLMDRQLGGHGREMGK